MDHKSIVKAVASVSALVASGVVSAAAYTPPAPEPACMAPVVSVPCEKQAWDFGAELIYVKQASETNWYVAGHSTASGDRGVTNAKQLDPKWAFGFRVEGSYHFGTGNDITVNWKHFSKKTDKNVNPYILNIPVEGPVSQVLDGNGNLVSIVPTGSTADTWDNANVYNKTKFDQVNFEFGQHVDYGDQVDVRFHSGLAFVRLSSDLRLAYSNKNGNNELWTKQMYRSTTHSKFTGVGPRFGNDISYEFSDTGFKVFGNYAVSALVGTLKSQIDVDQRTVVQVGVDDPQLVDVKSRLTGSLRSIVMGLETKLGVEYTHAMAAGDLSVYAAWQANIYQSILQQSNGNQNWGYQGPSIGFKWVGNV